LIFVFIIAGQIKYKLLICLFFFATYIATPPPADFPNKVKFLIFCFL